MEKVKWRKVTRRKGVSLTWETEQRRLKKFLPIAEDVADECGVELEVSDGTVSFYLKDGERTPTDPWEMSTFGVLVSPSDGDLVPDGWPGDDGADGDYCAEAPWKAKVIVGLMARLALSKTTAYDFEFARKVYAGEMVHPCVAESIR